MLDDAIRKAAAEADRRDAALKARQDRADAVAEVAVPKILALLADGRDRLRAAGVRPVQVIAPRKSTLFRPAGYAPRAAVWQVGEVAISLDDQVFRLSTTLHAVRDRRAARDRGLAVGDVYAVLGSPLFLRGSAGAEEVALRDCVSVGRGGSGLFHAGLTGGITVHTSSEPDVYTPLEDVIAAQVVAATRR
ncbi:hypothetical protein ABZ816_31525 [Actinosynnema sp. NPDC047251]|uniref:Uncharacterized protein n=1 Tax=Saccharothrix espanaensis (strain ATCC 51144 / DSM 44229 / JCM 9112 / NBRC 15066 / NRRL 15764) TaxID=1179773 RepID=K0JRA1_SACES|nr:hypothetical protein [Saccharothrix espanaensis]CCH30090.1 hypothetical protein BN6_27780 [Saccharothrix espanaensis DSM 44229]